MYKNIRFLHNARMTINIDDEYTSEVIPIMHIRDDKSTLILEYIDEVSVNIDEGNKDFLNEFKEFLKTEYYTDSVWIVSNIVTPIIVDKFIKDIPFYKDIFQFVNEDWYKLIYIVKLLSPNISKKIDTNLDSLTKLVSHYDKMVDFYDKI